MAQDYGVRFTFIPHCSNIDEPLLDCGHSMGWVLMATTGNLCDGGHGTFKCTTWFSYHGVVSKVKVQSLHDVSRVVT